jgi:hypothetical protein
MPMSVDVAKKVLAANFIQRVLGGDSSSMNSAMATNNIDNDDRIHISRKSFHPDENEICDIAYPQVMEFYPKAYARVYSL